MSAGLRRVGRQWLRLGAEDPLWAVLTDDDARHGRWDEEAFFASGRWHIARVLDRASALGVTPPRGSALDFGCGVGRLTVALAELFEVAHGVDISPSMIAEATTRQGHRARFHLNQGSDLSSFASGSIHLVTSTLVLQHMPRRLALGYISEFVRVLSPDGVAVFDVPDRLLPPTRLIDSRRLGWRLRNRAIRLIGLARRMPVMEMHMLSQADVRRAVVRAGGHVVDVDPEHGDSNFCRDVRYVVRPGLVSPTTIV